MVTLRKRILATLRKRKWVTLREGGLLLRKRGRNTLSKRDRVTLGEKRQVAPRKRDYTYEKGLLKFGNPDVTCSKSNNFIVTLFTELSSDVT